MNGELNRSYQISMNFHNEKKTIREKYRQTDFPTWFVDKVIHQFDQMLIDKQTEN